MYKKTQHPFYAKVLHENEYFRGISCVSHWISAEYLLTIRLMCMKFFFFGCYMKIWLAKIIKGL
jgi:hypothetical protein